MKDPRNLLGQSNICKRKMREVATHTAEPGSTQETTERILKILDSTYAKADLRHVADNNSHMNAEERTLLLILYRGL